MKTRNFVIVIASLLMMDLFLVNALIPHFGDVPNTGIWFCLECIGIVTEVGIGLIWYKLKGK